MDWHVFEPLGKALAEPQATGLMARVIEARGHEIGRHGRCHLPIRAGSR